MKEKKKFSEILKNLLVLYYEFVKIGAFTIGGGLAMMPMMQKELIDKKKWLTEEELIDYYAVGQSTPGIIAVNVATFVGNKKKNVLGAVLTFVGYKQFGVIGGIVGTLGIVTPSLVIIMILAGAINSISDYPIVQHALNGINVAVAALLTSVVFKFAKKTIKNIWNAMFMLLAFLLVFALKLPSYAVILFALVTGVIITFFQQRKIKKQTLNNVEVNKDADQNDKEVK